MAYRTRTYIAGDWTGDEKEKDKLYEWKNEGKWSLDFNDAHELTSARDSSLNCSIKSSLKQRLDCSKQFVLVVGLKTASLRSGGCHLCKSYNSYAHLCVKGNPIDYKSYIEYECFIAKRDIEDIVVLYASSRTDKSLCPESLKYVGVHIPMYYYRDGNCYWNYYEIKRALGQ